jgi:hypothetical protein
MSEIEKAGDAFMAKFKSHLNRNDVHFAVEVGPGGGLLAICSGRISEKKKDNIRQYLGSKFVHSGTTYPLEIKFESGVVKAGPAS